MHASPFYRELIGLDLPVTPRGRQMDTLPLWLARGLRTSVWRLGRNTESKKQQHKNGLDGAMKEADSVPPPPTPPLTVSPLATLEPVPACRAADSF